MMRIINYILPLFLLALIIQPASAAWGWQPYYHSINISVSDWHYNQTIGANVYVTHNISYAVFPINTLLTNMDINLLTIYGYDNGLNNLGKINYSIFYQSGSTAWIMIPNSTVSNRAWTKATIFYKAINWTLAPSKNPLPYSLGIDTYVSSIHQYDVLPAIIANSFTVFLNASTLTNTSYYYYPDNFNRFRIRFNSGTANITAFGISGNNYLTSGIFNSVTANQLFNGSYLYELYFSPKSYEFIGQRIYVNETATKMYNITTNKATQIYYFTNNIPKLIVNGTDHFNYIISPAFTTKVTVSNAINNPNPSGFTSGIFGMYQKYAQFNSSWIATFNTLTYPAHLGSIYTINMLSDYLRLRLAYISDFGDQCQYMYFRAYQNKTDIDLGEIPFYVKQCNSTGVELYLRHLTLYGYSSYNSFFMYYAYPFNAPIRSYSNSSLIPHIWLNISSNSITVYSTKAPFIIKLDGHLTPNSRIYTFWSSTIVGITNFNSSGDGSIDFVGQPYGYFLPAFNLFTDMLVTANSTTARYITNTLSAWGNRIGYTYVNYFNQTNTLITSYQSYTGTNNTYTEVRLSHMNASVVYPYATQYTVKAGRNIYDQIVINGSNYTIIPVIPKNAINVNNTSSNVVDSQVQFNGFNFSKVLLDVLVIIAVFVGTIMIKKNERTGETEGIVPFIIILIFAAIAGIPQALNSDYSIMVIVLIGVIMVITTEFTGRIK